MLVTVFHSYTSSLSATYLIISAGLNNFSASPSGISKPKIMLQILMTNVGFTQLAHTMVSSYQTHLPLPLQPPHGLMNQAPSRS
jgi:hypothetical protein